MSWAGTPTWSASGTCAPTDEMNLASTRRNWPSGRGFERWYGFLGAETNQWYPELVYDNHTVDQPKSPEEGYHFTEDITDKAIEFIRDAKAVAPEKPFFLYYAPGACHAPHHAPKEWSDKYKGKFDMGYEAMREQTLARQKELGIVPADTVLPPINPIGTPETRTGPDGKPFPAMDETRLWDSLSADEQRLFARMAEVYAGFLSHADHHIGRLLDFLEFLGERENTVIMLVSDNGASGEGGPNGSVNEMRFINGVPDDIESALAMIDDLGSPKTYNHYPNGWAMAFNTPFKMWKRYEFNGGTSDPCIISWPAGMKARGEMRDPVPPRDRPRADRPRRASASRRPTTIKGHVQSHFDGVSMRYSFDDADAPSTRHDAVLFDARIARDLARRLEGRDQPPHDERLEPLQRRRVGAVPHRGRPLRGPQPRGRAPGEAARAGRPLVRRGRRQRRVPARRPRADRDHPHAAAGALAAAGPLRLLPRLRRGPRGAGRQHPQPLLRDRRAGRHPGARRAGRAVRARSRFGGHSLYVKDNRLHYVNNYIGMLEQKIVATDDLPTGTNLILSASFDKTGDDPPGRRRRDALALARRREGRRGPRSRPRWASSCSPARVSASGATAATASPTTTPATQPWAFTGGTIHRVAVDVSGEPYLDLEREAQPMLMRE